nr:hypothetical protein [Streptomyces bambusae]
MPYEGQFVVVAAELSVDERQLGARAVGLGMVRAQGAFAAGQDLFQEDRSVVVPALPTVDGGEMGTRRDALGMVVPQDALEGAQCLL